MIHSKRVIFIVLPLLFVPLVHGMSSTPDACAVPRDPNWGKSGFCIQTDSGYSMTCCWEEPDILNPGETIEWCQKCRGSDCDEIFRSSSTGPLVIPDEGGVADEPTTSTPSPTSPPRPPTGGVFDPPAQTLSPPQDDGSGPLNPQGGGILQQPEEVGDPEDERESEEKEGGQGQDTAGPLT
ncbi:hypothetical protein BH23THE1_BH23THE1_17430 [soil metagenome]